MARIWLSNRSCNPWRSSGRPIWTSGPADPIILSNTYRFYLRGGRGVLVEPNPALAAKLRRVRPRDVVIEAGVGVKGDGAADYFVLSGEGAPYHNTFSREEAEVDAARSGGKTWISEVRKIPLIPINRVLADHFPARAPDFLSIDAEGLDHDILASLDFGRWRPKVVCAETLIVRTNRVEQLTIELMKARGYVIRGSTWVNTIFMDGRVVGDHAAKFRARTRSTLPNSDSTTRIRLPTTPGSRTAIVPFLSVGSVISQISHWPDDNPCATCVLAHTRPGPGTIGRIRRHAFPLRARDESQTVTPNSLARW
jgi:hypothetical protein